MEPLYIAFLLVTGMIAGFFSGMLGVGGCFIMVPVQFWILTSMGIEPTIATRISFGTALAVALPTSINGTLGHYRRGAVVRRASMLLGTTGVVGAYLGGWAASNAPGSLLRLIFGLVILIAALRMVAGSPKPSGYAENSDSNYLLFGLPLGFLCGLIGIGGGVLMVPVMVIFLGFDMHKAVGTSTAAIIFTSFGGVLSYVIFGLDSYGLPPHSLGYVNIFQWMLLAGTSIPSARIGVWASHKLKAKALKRVFITLMFYVALKMMGILELLQLPI